eukprot:3069656-Prymnesium_polylepis.1
MLRSGSQVSPTAEKPFQHATYSRAPAGPRYHIAACRCRTCTPPPAPPAWASVSASPLSRENAR